MVWSVIAVAVVFVPSVRIQTQTHHAIRVVYVLTTLALVLVFAVLVAVAAWLVRRDLVSALIAATMATGVFFLWGTFASVASDLHAVAGFLPADAVVVGLAAMLAAAAANWGRTWIVAGLFLLLFGGLAAAHVSEIITLTTQPQVVGSIVTSVGAPSSRPNVVVIVLDGHPREDTAKDNLGVDITTLSSAAEGLGFVVNREAWSNHTRTYASVSSMFALDDVIGAELVTDPLGAVRAVSGGDGEFLRAFSDAGYHITMAPSDWLGLRCGAVVDRCVRYGIVSSSAYWLLRGSILGQLVPSMIDHPWTTSSLSQLSGLSETHADATEDGRPSVVWVHALLPHPPVGLDASCEVRDEIWRYSFSLVLGDEFDDQRRQAFSDQIQCTDDLVLSEVAEIVERDPDVVVVIASDHGPDSFGQDAIALSEFNDQETKEKLAVLTAVREPSDCSAAEQSSTVDVLREIVRCVLDAEVSRGSSGHYLTPTETDLADGAEPVAVDVPALP